MDQFFSIIIPTLNEEFYLPLLLKDLSRQRSKNFEVIVVDSYSNDNTQHVIEPFIEEMPISFHQVEKHNVSYQRNYGAEKAKGNYLIFLDADCRIAASFTKSLYTKIMKKNGLIFLPYIEPDNNQTQHKILFQFSNFLVDISQIIGKPFSSGGSMIFERKFFKLVGGFDENLFLAEDHHLIQRALEWGVRAKFLEDIKVKISMRRLKKEGNLVSLYKYTMATAHIFFKGDIKTQIFEYKMGGDHYKKTKTGRYFTKQGNEEFWKTQLKQINSMLNRLLKE